MNNWEKWNWSYCPECKEPIKEAFQARCDFCNILFDWNEDIEG